MVTKPMTNTVELARELAQNGIAANAAKTDSTASFPEASIKALGESGLLGLMVPKAHGGKEATIREFVDTVSEIAASCASTGMIFVMHCCATHVIKNTLGDAAAAPILRDIAAGKHLTTLACSERGTGTHFYASHSTSKKRTANICYPAKNASSPAPDTPTATSSPPRQPRTADRSPPLSTW